MKKTFIRQAAVVTVLVGMATVPIFAAGITRGAGTGYNRGNFNEREEGFRGPRNFGPEIMGTIDGVDAKTGIITIENADGNKEQIHYNPTTKVYNFTDFTPADDFCGAGMGQGLGPAFGKGTGPGMMGLGTTPANSSVTNGTQKQLLDQRDEFLKEREAAVEKFTAELEKRQMKISDLKNGDWIQVRAYPSDTRTVESRMIRVYR